MSQFDELIVLKTRTCRANEYVKTADLDAIT